MTKIATKPDASFSGHVSGIQKIMEERKRQQGVGLLLMVFLEVVGKPAGAFQR